MTFFEDGTENGDAAQGGLTPQDLVNGTLVVDALHQGSVHGPGYKPPRARAGEIDEGSGH